MRTLGVLFVAVVFVLLFAAYQADALEIVADAKFLAHRPKFFPISPIPAITNLIVENDS